MQHVIRQDLIRAAKERFYQHNEAHVENVRPEILASWKRSRSYGIDPCRCDTHVLSPEELEKRIQLQQDFYDISVSLIEGLFAFTKESGLLIVLADAEGYVLACIGDNDIRALAVQNGLVNGSNSSERCIGTNAIGMVLETKAPVQVSGQEHFISPESNLVCSGAPVFAADGDLVGVICIVGKHEKVSIHTLGMAFAVSEAATKQLRMKAAHDSVGKAQKNMSAIIEHIQSGLLLVDRDMVIKLANSRAERLFDLPGGGLVGKTFNQAFGERGIGFEELHAGVSDRNITLKKGGRSVTVSLSSVPADSGEYVVTLEKTEALHKKINKIFGSEASFHFADIVGQSKAMTTTTSLARIAAENNSSVLLTGESGTGKELFAQSIHNAGSRASGPFVAINCGALPKSLIESELFGYEGGSFTGARKDGSPGKFELANGGTIFLDEIGDMPFDVQVNLLRVLQNREIVRLGSKSAIKIDVRIIAATNQDLHEVIKNNAFRSDLYYRLNVFNIQIPPLRERHGDVRLLADYFLEKYASLSNNRIDGFTEEAYAIMERYRWPGNIRQLENAVERAIYIAKEGRIDPSCLPPAIISGATGEQLPPVPYQRDEWSDGRDEASDPADQPSPTSALSLKNNEKQLIKDAIRSTGGNIKKAAEILGISRKTIYRKIDKYSIEVDELRL